MLRIIRRTLRTIKKVFAYLPLLWNDSDYDYSSIYGLLHLKFSRMEKVWADYDQDFSYEGQEDDHETIKELKRLSGRLYEDEYLSESLVDHYEKWGDYMDFNDFIADTPDENGLYRWIGDTNKERHEEFMECSAQSKMIWEREKNELFNLLLDNIDKLWI